MATTPLLIDTDMGLDDAVALTLALSEPTLDVCAIVATGGNIPLEQAVINIGRLLHATGMTDFPTVGRGLDQDEAQLERAHHVHGDDGFGGVDMPPAPDLSVRPWRDAYRHAVRHTGGKLQVVAVGPLTTLAAALDEPDIRGGITHLHIMGGAVRRPGNVTPHAEFNFYRDPAAAKKVLAAGIPVTLTPLDVTERVHVDESHVAHLAASGSRPAAVLARILAAALERSLGDGGYIVLHDAVSVARLIWPDLFKRMHARLEITTAGAQAGRSRPVIGGTPSEQAEILMGIDADELLEGMWEVLCHERFIV